MQSPARKRFHGNQLDWDISRAQHTGWQAWLNVGAPVWWRELKGQILDLVDRSALDATFLSCIEVCVNAPTTTCPMAIGRLPAGCPTGSPIS